MQMNSYLLIYSFIGIVSFASSLINKEVFNRLGMFVIYSVLFLFIGLKYNVGADYHNYELYYQATKHANINQIFDFTEPGYSLIMFLLSKLGLSFLEFNLFLSFLFIHALRKFSEIIEAKSIFLIFAFPYLIMVVYLGYFRQAFAISILIYAIYLYYKEEKIASNLALFTAPLVHYSAFFFAFLIFTSKFKLNFLKVISLIFGVFVIAIIYNDILWNYFDMYITKDNFISPGAFYRVPILSVSSIIFFYSRRAFLQNYPAIYRFLFFVSVLNILGLILLFLMPELSTMIDRLLLYSLPAFCLICSSFINFYKDNKFIYASLALSAFIFNYLYVYLWTSTSFHAPYWVPYQVHLN